MSHKINEVNQANSVFLKENSDILGEYGIKAPKTIQVMSVLETHIVVFMQLTSTPCGLSTTCNPALTFIQSFLFISNFPLLLL